jgi:hypothetical protein
MKSEGSNLSIGQPTPERPPPIEPGPSPFWPQHLRDLFFRPRRFFSGQLALGKTPYLVLVTWCYGISSAIDRIDRELLRVELGRARPSWERLGPMITESWLGFWLWVLLAGALGGIFIWWVGGWWFRVRLEWSGALEPDKRLARLVFVYSSFVATGPAVALAVGYSLVYPSYAAAFAADEPYSALFLIFPFWSLISSYLGVRTLFEASRWKARVWFVILPGILYLLLFGVVALLLSLAGG